MPVSHKAATCIFLVGVFVITTLKVARPRQANAQDDQVEILDACVNEEIDTDSNDTDYLVITNNCGERIHAYWGPYDEDSERGTIMYSMDLEPGGTERQLDAYGSYYAVGCSATPIPGHAYGYKLTYKDAVGRTVTSYQGIDNLVCMLW